MKIKLYKNPNFKIFLIRVSQNRFTIKTVLDDGLVLYKTALSKKEADEKFFELVKTWKAVYQIF